VLIYTQKLKYIGYLFISDRVFENILYRKVFIMKIAHISDLHLPLNFVKEWGENLLDFLNDAKPDLLIVTGDLTDDGYCDEFDKAKAYLDRFEIPKRVVVPGNHDASNMGYSVFEELFKTRFPSYEDEKVVVVGFDSTTPDIDDGHIGRENYPILKEKLKDNKKFKIMALHHHIIPVPGTGRERNILVDAGDVLKLFVDLDVQLVLSGHKHLPWIWKVENTHFITAGTATSRRLKGRTHPSFNMIELGDEEVVIDEINTSNGDSREILRFKRDINQPLR
jgi:3',5'-cyclic AMP phosphodiesterase CpdA